MDVVEGTGLVVVLAMVLMLGLAMMELQRVRIERADQRLRRRQINLLYEDAAAAACAGDPNLTETLLTVIKNEEAKLGE